MKKIIALLLCAMICLPLVACTNEEEIKALNEKIAALEEQLKNDSNNAENINKEIVGEWKEVDGYTKWTFTILEDGTLIRTTSSGKTYIGAWKYDADLNRYIVDDDYEGMLLCTKIYTTQNGARYIKLDGIRYYHTDDLDKVVTED